MWNVLPGDQYFPAYFAGLAPQLHAAAEPDALLRGHDPFPRDRGEIFELARHLQHNLALSFNQAGWLLGEIRYCVEQACALPAFSLWQQRSFEGSRCTEIARRVNEALHGRQASSGFESWRVGDDPGRRQSDAVFLRADARYCWAPEAFMHLDLAWARLQLDCAIKQSGNEVTLRFVANDQLGWLFPDAAQHIERAIIAAFAACRPKPASPRPQAFPRGPRPGMEFLVPTNAPRTSQQKLEWIAGFTLVRYCKTLLEADRPADALDWSEHAARRLPEASFCASVRGVVHLASGRTAQALADFDRATQLDWRNSSACTGRASVHCVLNNLRQAALAECNAAIGQGFADGWLYELRGSICHVIGNFSQAEEDYTVARRLHAPAVRPSLEQRIRLAAQERPCDLPRYDAKEWVLPLLFAWRRHPDV